MWIKAAYGEGSAALWQALSDNIVTVTPSWDQAYGLFLKGEADMVLSKS
jgi:thiamine transport system substrate-binding protein